MEKIYDNNNFERYIKEQADDFRMIPSKRVWHSLYNDMHPGRKWPSFLMFFILTTGVLYIGKENTSIPNTINNGQQPSYSKNKKTKKESKNNKFFAANQKDIAFTEIYNNDYLYMPEWMQGEYFAPGIINEKDNLITNNNSENTSKSQSNKPANISRKTNEITIDNTFDETYTNESKSNSADEIAKADKKEEKQKTEKNKIALADAKEKNEVTAFKSKKGKKDATTIEFYATPSIGFRKLNIDNAFSTNNFATTNQTNTNTNEAFMQHKPALNLEAGFNFAFAATKKISFKAGVQLNLTNYGIKGSYLTHTAPTSLAEINPQTGNIDYNTVSAIVTNDKNSNKNINNTTYQISLPVGAYYKVLAKSKFDLFVGASVQPTLVFGGNPNVISADKMYYVSNPSLLRKWNMNTAAEAYVNYKFGNLNLLAGPQVRYQIFSTYKSNIVVSEKLYNIGFKIGLAKTF
ncbi:MAG: hypothetical protein KA319_13740 [Ferruginibacter sp.]|nr:hypothetical protein [Ferruginibacter sp.]